MKATYLGLQKRINKTPMILVNVKEDFGVNTVVYNPQEHELSTEDLHCIFRDAKALSSQDYHYISKLLDDRTSKLIL